MIGVLTRLEHTCTLGHTCTHGHTDTDTQTDRQTDRHTHTDTLWLMDVDAMSVPLQATMR